METQHLTPALERLRLHESPLLTSPDQNPNPNPNPNQNPNPNPHLRPSKSTAFKREERRKRKERKRQQRLQTLFDHPPPSVSPNPTVSDLPWPCDPAPSDPLTPTAWPPTSSAGAATASAAPAPPPPSAAAHAAALRSSRAFFASEAESNGEDDDTEEEGDEIGGRARGFFKDLFARDGDLREYYEREWARGEFRCLVCEGVGARAGKRFWGCAALVQHAAAVARTRARRAHRAFGSVVRRVLGWEDLQADTLRQMDTTIGQLLHDRPSPTRIFGTLADMREHIHMVLQNVLMLPTVRVSEERGDYAHASSSNHQCHDLHLLLFRLLRHFPRRQSRSRLLYHGHLLYRHIHVVVPRHHLHMRSSILLSMMRMVLSRSSISWQPSSILMIFRLSSLLFLVGVGEGVDAGVAEDVEGEDELKIEF